MPRVLQFQVTPIPKQGNCSVLIFLQDVTSPQQTATERSPAEASDSADFRSAPMHRG